MALGAVNAVVQAPRQAVHERLAVEPVALVAEAGEHDLPEVGHAVAVPILQVDEVGLETDVDAAVIGDHGRGIAQLVREDAALVEAAVAVDVLQQPDPADALVEHQVGARLGLIPAHFDDVQPAVLVERHLDRIDHHGLVRDQLEAESFLDAEGLERLVRLDRRDVRHFLGIDLEAEREIGFPRIQIPIAGVRLAAAGGGAWGGSRRGQQRRCQRGATTSVTPIPARMGREFSS